MDSDGDELNDDEEKSLNSNSFIVDTDNDGYWDGEDKNPLIFFLILYMIDRLPLIMLKYGMTQMV